MAGEGSQWFRWCRAGSSPRAPPSLHRDVNSAVCAVVALNCDETGPLEHAGPWKFTLLEEYSRLNNLVSVLVSPQRNPPNRGVFHSPISVDSGLVIFLSQCLCLIYMYGAI